MVRLHPQQPTYMLFIFSVITRRSEKSEKWMFPFYVHFACYNDFLIDHRQLQVGIGHPSQATRGCTCVQLNYEEPI